MHVETSKFFYMPEFQGGGTCPIAGDANNCMPLTWTFAKKSNRLSLKFIL